MPLKILADQVFASRCLLSIFYRHYIMLPKLAKSNALPHDSLDILGTARSEMSSKRAVSNCKASRPSLQASLTVSIQVFHRTCAHTHTHTHTYTQTDSIWALGSCESNRGSSPDRPHCIFGEHECNPRPESIEASKHAATHLLRFMALLSVVVLCTPCLSGYHSLRHVHLETYHTPHATPGSRTEHR